MGELVVKAHKPCAMEHPKNMDRQTQTLYEDHKLYTLSSLGPDTFAAVERRERQPQRSTKTRRRDAMPKRCDL